jgi:hypothetical protein
MRETRQSGSEGGGGDSPYPYHVFRCNTGQRRDWPTPDFRGAHCPIVTNADALVRRPRRLQQERRARARSG